MHPNNVSTLTNLSSGFIHKIPFVNVILILNAIETNRDIYEPVLIFSRI